MENKNQCDHLLKCKVEYTEQIINQHHQTDQGQLITRIMSFCEEPIDLKVTCGSPTIIHFNYVNLSSGNKEPFGR